MPNTPAGSPGMDMLRQWMDEIGREKSAAPEGVGKTTFPQDSVDDGTHEETEGARSAENERDIKKTIPGENIDSAPEAKPGEDAQNELQPNIGPHQSLTGEDPSVEDDYKSHKDDPGTSSPARVDDGEKYGSWDLEKLLKQHEKAANALLAEFIVENKQKAGKQAGTGGKSADVKAAAAAGYAAAADTDVTERIWATLKEAEHMADLTAQYLQLRKQAEEEGDDDADDHGGPSDGDADDGGEEAPPVPGGAPMAAAPGGADPAMGGDGGAVLDQMFGGEDPNAAPSHDETMEGMNGAMDDLHLSPELIQELIQLLQAQGGDGPKVASVVKQASDEALKYRRTGRYEVGPAKTARVRKLRTDFRTYLSELVKRAGAK